MNKKTLCSLIAAACLSGAAHGEIIDFSSGLLTDDIYIYDFGYGGTGCPSDSVGAVMSPDFKKISMFFDQYIADSTLSNRGRARKSCNLGVAVRVPHGLSVSLVSLDYRGYVDNAPGAYASLQAEYFFAGQSVGGQLKKEWFDPDEEVVEDFVEEDEFELGTIVWSPCGEDAIIRANTSIKAYESAAGEPALIQVDTVDATAEVVYQLQWKTCDADTGN
jgi:hypothetical protein